MLPKEEWIKVFTNTIQKLCLGMTYKLALEVAEMNYTLAMQSDMSPEDAVDIELSCWED